ncbi:hypothetical protein MKJ01_18670 [Chryseobacterium sp. SSA4.19]|nr:hypothetical protein [Chryseobacterium sp. SSA4.19]
MAAELNNFNDVLEVFKANGKDYRFTYVPAEIFSNFFEGAREVAELLAYFEAYSYMGPNSDNQVQKAKEISTEPFVSLNDWIKLNVL